MTDHWAQKLLIGRNASKCHEKDKIKQDTKFPLQNCLRRPSLVKADGSGYFLPRSVSLHQATGPAHLPNRASLSCSLTT